MYVIFNKVYVSFEHVCVAGYFNIPINLFQCYICKTVLHKHVLFLLFILQYKIHFHLYVFIGHKNYKAISTKFQELQKGITQWKIVNEPISVYHNLSSK